MHSTFTRIPLATLSGEKFELDLCFRKDPFLELFCKTFTMATPNEIRDSLSSYDPRSMIQCDVMATIAPHVLAIPQPISDVCVSNLRADLPAEVLCAREMFQGPTALYRLIRDYLVVKGFSYTPHTTTNRISHGLVNMVYIDDTDRMLANQGLTIVASGSTQGSHQSFPPTLEALNSKIAHNI